MKSSLVGFSAAWEQKNFVGFEVRTHTLTLLHGLCAGFFALTIEKYF
jgi:hypothetical protein